MDFRLALQCALRCPVWLKPDSQILSFRLEYLKNYKRFIIIFSPATAASHCFVLLDRRLARGGCSGKYFADFVCGGFLSIILNLGAATVKKKDELIR